MFAAGDSPISGELAEAAFLLRTGWTWDQYENAPDGLVRNMMILLNAEAEYAKSRTE